ncbi:heme biosynthesis protein HemY [Candidatus Nitrosacidococcus sp. I8]|uniref:heme biosynthesis protein HemY n=1 Tax=Candidatus Nitrosacidococcus sp. I8 TaxID=2942908 RepID=UPI0022261431|nr:heme biosynthesis protein HemY [Candidatus Nitrosacidococcus sp. I8]CAH9019914.1 Protein HemY [Candidatus Nitrosacidococcus sp. I8]
MKIIIFILITLILGVSLGLLTKDDPGYITIGYDQWSIETTLVLGIATLATIVVAGYFIIRIFAHAYNIPKKFGELQEKYQISHANKLFVEGLIDLEEGNWTRSEYSLVKDIKHSSAPLFNYLSAASAAQNQGAYDRRDAYLRLASETTPAASFAIGLAQAEFQLNSDQYSDALTTLNQLRSIDSKHPQPLKLLKNLYLQQKDWNQLLGLLPDLKRQKLINKEEQESLETIAYTELLLVASQRGITFLTEEWKAVPTNLQQNSRVITTYAYMLSNQGKQDEAEQLIQNALKKKWADELIHLYGTIQSSNKESQLSWAETWLNQYGQNPWLLLTLGRLSKQNNLWEKAKQYLEKSISYAPNAESYEELGEVFKELGKLESALEYYRKGLSMVTDGNSNKIKFNLPQTPNQNLVSDNSNGAPRLMIGSSTTN